ncbi:MAG: outer membrane protein assembly factor BamA [Candidatus Zixiibacteriota bacterium]
MNTRAGTALIVWLAMMAFGIVVTAQESLNVTDVEVVGNRVATSSLVMGVSSIDKGSPLTPASVQETIRRLYRLGVFESVAVEAERTAGGVKVFIVVKELPKLAGLEFSGNKEFKSKELQEKLKLGVGGYISPYLIAVKKQEIVKAYADKGYFRTEVSSSLNYSADSSEAVLTYRIDERSKVKVEQVIMTGNVRVKASDLIGKMRNRKRGFLKSSTFVEEKYEEDLRKVADEYHKKGYIDAYIVSDSTRIDSTTNRMKIYLDVYEGPLYYFGKAEFKNNEALKTDVLRKKLKFKEDDIFNAEVYEKSLYELYTAYQDIGHLHVRVNDERTTRTDSIVDIAYDIAEGLPSHINLVKIVGNSKTKDRVIRRELSVLPGQVFNRALLIRSVRDVMALNFFSNVEPVPIDLPNGDVDLEVKVDEKQTGQISAGAGYNSQDKLVGTLGMGIPNLGGNGQNLTFNIEFGKNRNSFSLSFTEPWLFGKPTLLGSDAYLANRRWYDEYTEGRQGGSVRLGRRLSWPDNYFRAYAAFRLERNRFYDFSDAFDTNNRFKSYYYKDSDSSGAYSSADSLVTTHTYGAYPGSVLAYNEDWNTASRLSLTITRDSRNLPEFATKGSEVSYTFENTGGLLGGFWHYQKHQLSLSKFVPLIGNTVALAARVQYAMLTAPDGDSRILVSDRFSPGGTAYDGIVRGYDDGILTPDSVVAQSDSILWYNDPNPDTLTDTAQLVSYNPYTTRVRGKYMLVTNLELQFAIAKQQFYGLLFFDAGNSWLRRTDIKPLTDLYRGVGFGFRVVVPGIGTIGFDFGYPLDKYRHQKQSWKPHFQIGTTFR